MTTALQSRHNPQQAHHVQQQLMPLVHDIRPSCVYVGRVFVTVQALSVNLLLAELMQTTDACD
jgi:hypothetical protein